MNITVVIPALNEAAVIGAAIRSAADAFEVIVVDGGSCDATALIAKESGARVLYASAGRGGQMDAGANEAKGEVLLFLHADARLPRYWRPSVISALSDERIAAGAFTLTIESAQVLLRVIERLSRLRARLFGLVYGDQALFVKKTAFMSVGGFRKLPLMEDVDCVKRLRRMGGIRILADRVTVSPRRWNRSGALKTTFKNITILTLYFLGYSPAKLYAIYYDGSSNSA